MLKITNQLQLLGFVFSVAMCATPAIAQAQSGTRPANSANGSRLGPPGQNSPNGSQIGTQNNSQSAFQNNGQRQQSAVGNSGSIQSGGNSQTVGQSTAQSASQPSQPRGPSQTVGTVQQIPIVPAENAVAAGLAQVVQQPFPPLNAAEQNYIDQVLDVWEKRTAQINTFECNFKRYVFNATVDPENPESVAEGVIRYKNPDKGVFKEDNQVTLAGKKPDGSPDYKVNPAAPHGDWWVCDGEWVHNLNRREKKAIRTQLPPELRGNNIPLSPLPFLFGVKAAEVKARYYVRGLTPPKDNNDVWIEAWPKRADDAGNYSRVQVALDRSDSLPNAMIMYMPNWANNAPNREVFNFFQREVNSNNLLDKIKESVFMKSFIDTKVPSDWNVIQEPWLPPQQQQAQAGPTSPSGQPSGLQATSPTQSPKR